MAIGHLLSQKWLEKTFTPSGPTPSRPVVWGHLNPGSSHAMVALLVLLLILALFGGLGFAAHFLWFVLIVMLALWALGFLVGGAGGAVVGGRRRWYGRW